MEIDTQVTLELLREYQAAHLKDLQKRKPRRHTPLELTIVVIVYLALLAAIYYYQESFSWPAVIILALVFLALYADILLRDLRIAQAIKVADDGLLLGQHHYRLSEQGINASGKGYNMFVGWSLVSGTLETKNLFIIQLDQLAAFILVKRDVTELDGLRYMTQQYVE